MRQVEIEATKPSVLETLHATCQNELVVALNSRHESQERRHTVTAQAARFFDIGTRHLRKHRS